MARRKRAAKPPLPPAPRIDLTTPVKDYHEPFAGLDGQRIVDVAAATLASSESLLQTWTTLEPVVRRLIEKVSAYADTPRVTEQAATALLKDVAGVSRAVAAAATSVMRASEGQARLAVLVAGPRPARVTKDKMTERQLVAVVMETARAMRRETGGPCPLCAKTLPKAPPAGGATNGAAVVER